MSEKTFIAKFFGFIYSINSKLSESKYGEIILLSLIIVAILLNKIIAFGLVVAVLCSKCMHKFDIFKKYIEDIIDEDIDNITQEDIVENVK